MCVHNSLFSDIMGAKGPSMAGKTREEKMKMMKTSQTRKTVQRLGRAAGRGKLKKYVRDRLQGIKAAKGVESRKRIANIEEDYENDRRALFDDEDHELPLDMMNAEIDWDNSAFAGAKRRRLQKLQEETEQAAVEKEDSLGVRKFKGEFKENEEEILPIKLPSGEMVRQTRMKEEEDEDDMDEMLNLEEDETEKEEDISELSAVELLARRKELMQEAKQTIAGLAHSITADPQNNVYKLRDLFHVCEGKKLHSLVRETGTKLAVASMVQVLVDIIPGYTIRLLTAAEKAQSQTKDTKKLQNYEESLLRYYLKFLQLAEKNAMKLVHHKKFTDEYMSTFAFKMSMLSVKAMCKLLTAAPHFNYATNVVNALTRVSISKYMPAVEEICTAFTHTFREDNALKMSMFMVKTLTSFIKKKTAGIHPQLLYTFLGLNIREVKDVDKKSHKGRVFSQRARLKRERESKGKKKYEKQLKKLEADMKELDAEELVTTRLRYATETMKELFVCYFSIVRRMPSAALLPPVLEGLSKFAHMLNVEFFEDIIKCMEELVDAKHMRLLDSLHCVNTVFVILSGDGKVLNVDPFRFYRTVYRLLSKIPYEKDPELFSKTVVMVCKSLDLMINSRRKQVPLERVCAFVKRLLTLAISLEDNSAAMILALIRSFFIAHPKLSALVCEEDLEGGEGGRSATYRADLDDPDVCRAAGSDALLELKVLGRRPGAAGDIADNVLAGCPSIGSRKLNPTLINCKPWKLFADLCEKNPITKITSDDFEKVIQLAKKSRQQQVTSANIHFQIGLWLDTQI